MVMAALLLLLQDVHCQHVHPTQQLHVHPSEQKTQLKSRILGPLLRRAVVNTDLRFCLMRSTAASSSACVLCALLPGLRMTVVPAEGAMGGLGTIMLMLGAICA
jgi:hypothetical protein